jgi:hypothetical protein
MDKWFIQSLDFFNRTVENMESDIKKACIFVTLYKLLTHPRVHHTGQCPKRWHLNGGKKF